MTATVRCGCGAEHERSTLHKVGWTPDGRGGALLLARCTCGSPIAMAILTDASFCRGCGRLMHGEVKIVAEDVGVMCVPCARRSRHAIAPPVRRVRLGGAQP